MILFALAIEDNQVFNDALRKYFAGEPDQLTLHCYDPSALPGALWEPASQDAVRGRPRLCVG